MLTLTCDRFDQLKTCLNSQILLLQKLGRKPRLLICDDSRNLEQRKSNKSYLAERTKNLNLKISYCSLDERIGFIHELEKQGLEREILCFLLDSRSHRAATYGANRNAGLLASLDERVFSLDDDIVLEPLTLEKANSKLEIDHYAPLHNLRVFETREEALKNTVPFNGDPFQIFEKHLGHFAQANDSYQIRASFGGIVGDSGSQHPLSLFSLSKKDFKRWLRSERHYKILKTTRAAIRLSPHILIRPAGLCMTTNFMMDAGFIPPPFFPCYREEDALFGEVLQSIDFESSFALVPVAFKHLPLEQRRYEENDFKLNTSLSIRSIISFALTEISSFNHSHVFLNFKTIGERLKTLANLPRGDFLEWIKPYVLKSRIQAFEHWCELLKQIKSPPAYLKNDLIGLKQQSEENLNKPLLIAPDYLSKSLGQIAAEEEILKFLKLYGRSLCEWPSILEGTRLLKQKNTEITENLIDA